MTAPVFTAEVNLRIHIPPRAEIVEAEDKVDVKTNIQDSEQVRYTLSNGVVVIVIQPE